jgi:hypothetical protein
MKGFYYVYILVSEADGRLHYSGLTRDLNTRLAEHNRGEMPLTPRSTAHEKSKQQSHSDRKQKLAVLNVILRQDPDVNLRAATCDSFRGCHAGGRRGDRRRTFNVQLKRGELRFRRNYPGALIARPRAHGYVLSRARVLISRSFQTISDSYQASSRQYVKPALPSRIPPRNKYI